MDSMTLPYILVHAYWFGALLVFTIYLTAFLSDQSTPKTDITSWLVVILGAAFWFIVFPVSVIRKLRSPDQSNLMPYSENLNKK
jgi:predicted MFS family arabinose efflux permease